ncbi:MAG: preprotein translocase subunit SecG [Paludibacteraceae bacterium]|nr:preprotein translocase subunit SecG [Paludibacteraceae bacterium]
MYTFFTILIVIAAILLIFLVLVQNSKGGGLAAGFASGNQVMGAPKTADFLEKASWTLAAIIVFLSILAVGINRGQSGASADESAIMEQVEEAASALPTPAAPAAEPAAEQPAEQAQE